MAQVNHLAIFLSNNANKLHLTHLLIGGKLNATLPEIDGKKGLLFSSISLAEFIEEEALHEEWILSKQYNRSIRNLSSGEQKKALLSYLLSQKPDYIILDNLMDNLDLASQEALLISIKSLATHTSIIQLINRHRDYLPFIPKAFEYSDDGLTLIDDIKEYVKRHASVQNNIANATIPPPITAFTIDNNELVSFKNVTVKYEDRVIVKDINWTINKGEFWQLLGPNGSGKTTLLTMINGDNPKAYNQDLTLFGRRKGTGETVWEIKRKIGYLTPSMTDLFNTRHTLEQMIISGFVDSIGLYKQPSDMQIRLADEWLELIEMFHLKKKVFCQLSLGQQRLALVARAMVKHPPLLILDEAMSGLDDHNAALVTNLVNKIAAESNTAILYVSHRKEEGLLPEYLFELTPSDNGSTGKIHS